MKTKSKIKMLERKIDELNTLVEFLTQCSKDETKIVRRIDSFIEGVRYYAKYLFDGKLFEVKFPHNSPSIFYTIENSSVRTVFKCHTIGGDVHYVLDKENKNIIEIPPDFEFIGDKESES